MLSFLLAIAATIYLFYLFSQKLEKVELLTAFELLKESSSALILVVLLMPLNWLIETYKWRYLLLKVQPLGLWKSLQSILLGTLLSLLSPNRTGELAGRLLYVEKSNRWQVFYVNLLCSLSQLSNTFFFGLCAIIYWRLDLQNIFKLNQSWIAFLSVLGILVLAFLYTSSNGIWKLLRFFNRKFDRNALILKYSLKDRFILFSYSTLRYFVFALQFVTLLMVLDSAISFFEAFFIVALIYMLTAAIPTAWISDFPIRTSIAYFLLESFGFSGLAGLIASVSLWLINLFVPALVGFSALPKLDWLSIKKLRVND